MLNSQMSVTGKRVVFIIQCLEHQAVDEKKLGRAIRHSVLRLLQYFRKSCDSKSSTVQDIEDCELKWAYRFMNSTSLRTFRSMQDWKEFNDVEFLFFEDEVKYITEEERNCPADLDVIVHGGAHALSEELMSVMHDYAWPASISDTGVTVKPARVRSGSLLDSRKQMKENVESGYFSSVFNSFDQSPCKLKANFVVILGPIPEDQCQLETYFEWCVDDVSYIQNKLMPKHLRTYFRDGHNIILLWVDTGEVLRPNLHAPEKTGVNSMMEQFLETEGGAVLSIAELLPDFDEKVNSTSDTMYTDQWCVTSVARAGVQNSFLECNQPSVLDYSLHQAKKSDLGQEMHICRKLFRSGCVFRVEKLWSLLAAPLTMIDEKGSLPPSSISHLCSNNSCETICSENKPEVLCKIQFKLDTICAQVSASIICIPDDDLKQSCVSFASPQPESVLIVVGVMRSYHLHQIIRSRWLNGLHALWSCICSDTEDSCRMFFRRQNLNRDFVYILKAHEYCVKCGAEPSIDHCPTVRYVLLQPLTVDLALMMYIRSSSGMIMSDVMGSAMQVPVDENSSTGEDICEISKSHEPKKRGPTVNPTSFNGYLFEEWCISMTSDKKYWHIPIFDRERDLKISVHTEILHELEDLYSVCVENGHDLAVERKDNVSSGTTDQVCFESEEDMLNMLSEEYDQAIGTDVDVTHIDASYDCCSVMVKIARSLVDTIFYYMQNEKGTDWKLSSRNFAERHLFRSVAEVREPQQKVLQNCIMQILLRLEVTYRIPFEMETTNKIAEEISFFLRTISLTNGPSAMTRCLSHLFVDNYVMTCGELLCEVHSELMQPLPPCLQPYASEPSEESYLVSSIPDSVSSSVTSICSSAGTYPSRNGARFPRISSRCTANARQIAVPGTFSHNTGSNSAKFSDNAENSIKSRLRSSARKNSSSVVEKGTKKLGHVKRDLFSMLENDEDKLQKTGEKKHTKLSVSDTPNAKQGMTALARQRLRLRRERRGDEDNEPLAVIEESPAKFDEGAPSNCLETQRSPRHKVMIARRHSFYCDGKRSRAVTRAKTVQHRQHMAPSTPNTSAPKRCILQPIDMSSANSLPHASNDGNMQSPLRVRVDNDRLLTCCDDSPAKNTRSQATKALFRSPERRAKVNGCSPRASYIEAPVREGISICGIQPLAYTPSKTNQASQPTSPCTLALFAKTESDDTLLDLADRDCTIANSTPVADAKRLGTLDGFVIRSTRHTPPTISSRGNKKRKLSVDTTPTRDDINRWPRKKRGVDKSSPGVVSRRKSWGKLDTPLAVLPTRDCLLPPSQRSGPVTFCDSSNGKGGCRGKDCSVHEGLQAMKTMLSESNGQQCSLYRSLGLDDLMNLPTSPKLTLNDRLGANSAGERSLSGKEMFTRALKEPSNLSVLHIQSSPIIAHGAASNAPFFVTNALECE